MSWKWCRATVRVTGQHGDDRKVFHLRISRKKRPKQKSLKVSKYTNISLTETKRCYSHGRFFNRCWAIWAHILAATLW